MTLVEQMVVARQSDDLEVRRTISAHNDEATNISLYVMMRRPEFASKKIVTVSRYGATLIVPQMTWKPPRPETVKSSATSGEAFAIS